MMEFGELKAEMEGIGFKFEWKERDENTGKVKFHAMGWWMHYPPAPGYHFPRIFVPMNAPRKEAYLNVALANWEKRHDGDEEERQGVALCHQGEFRANS